MTEQMKDNNPICQDLLRVVWTNNPDSHSNIYAHAKWMEYRKKEWGEDPKEYWKSIYPQQFNNP
jgi:hypothetical protein